MARVAARRHRVGSRGFWLALAVVGLVAAGLRLCTSERGQALLVRWGVTRVFLPHLATRLDVNLARCLLEMGLVRGDLRAKQVAAAGRSVREYTFTAPAHLTPTQCHLKIRSAVRAVNGDVVRAEERHERGDALVLWLGFGSTVTHRVVVYPSQKNEARAHGGRSHPRIALIVDDFGHNMRSTVRGFLDLGVPFTVAVLPDLSKSSAVIEAAQERGLPVLLHLPMQPAGDENPGKDPVTVEMSADQIEALIERHMRAYRGFIGVNNHMGSRATADRATMQALAQALRRRDLFFVDSETTPRTLGAKVFREAGVWCLRNDLFLDDKAEPTEMVAANLEHLASIARKNGLAVGIAHPHKDTLQALRAGLPRLQGEGIEFVTVEALRPQTRVASQPR